MVAARGWLPDVGGDMGAVLGYGLGMSADRWHEMIIESDMPSDNFAKSTTYSMMSLQTSG